MFNSLSDRLTATFKNLRGHGRLTEADIDGTIREIRRALLDADVAVEVVREFTGAVRERALGTELSGALNPAQQMVKIVHEELIGVLGGQTRTLQWAKNPPTVIMLAGLQGAGKTTLAGKLGLALREQGHTPLLVAADLQRPNAVTQLQVVGERAGVKVFAPHKGNVGASDEDAPLIAGSEEWAQAERAIEEARAEAERQAAAAREVAARQAAQQAAAQQAADEAAARAAAEQQRGRFGNLFRRPGAAPAPTQPGTPSGSPAGAAPQAPQPLGADRTQAVQVALPPRREVADPVQVARDGLAFAREKLYDVVIIDTAGRLGMDTDLMKQASDIRDATNPDDVLFVIDAMIGQDAVATAKAFQEGVGFTGVVLAKLDGDARGGAALSVASVTGRPIMFASTGEKLTDFEVFHPDRMASRILDMGDILTLIEQAERAFDAAEAEKMAAKVAKGEDFTLADFLVQMEQMKKMGSMKKMLGMLPGMGEMREAIENFDEREVDRIKAIIQSMTPGEREQPKIINGSRRARIAKGAGTTTTAVNQLLDRFADAQKMMRQVKNGGGLPGMPGMPGLGGRGKKAGARTAAPQQGKKAKSGNPAKRAQQEKEALAKALGGPNSGNAFGANANAGSAFGF
ncbi:MAG: signal recognition particle protein Srp54 [Cellulomonadaceae bacterium]|nr:signal recognition particle protein Srp54 [Cellulomonadaceae bacterium]